MILAVDLGSSTVKAGLFSESGALMRSLSAGLSPRISADPAEHEVPPNAWADALASILPPLAAGSGRLSCLVLSGNGPTVVPVDRYGLPLRDAVTWLDRRAAAEAAEASAAAGIELDQGFLLPRALWFRRRMPEVYERTAAFLSCPEYVAMLLTGEAVTVVPPGYERHYGEGAALAALGLDDGRIPRRVGPGSVVGESGAAAEARFGLPRGVPVVLTGPDYLASIVGTAATRPGRACDRAGSSEGVNLCSDRSIDEPRLLCMPHLARPHFNISGTSSTSGRALAWWRDSIERGGADYAELFAEAGRSAPGASRLLFLPYLSGERSPIHDPDARGVFLGLSLSHDRSDMARAVVESTAFAMRDIIEVMEAAGASLSEIRVAGGPGRSGAWNRIKADVIGKPVASPLCPEPELQGDVCIALAATGRCASVSEAADGIVRLGDGVEPDPATRGLYDDLFAVYREAYRALAPVFKNLRAVGT
jgi:xylulokinase